MLLNLGRIRNEKNITDSKWQLVFNEKAGRLSPSKSRRRLEHILDSLNLEYDFVLQTNSLEESLKHLIAQGNRNFIVAGGDGSLNYFVNALYKNESFLSEDIFILPFPLGSGNDYCKSLNIKSTNDYISNGKAMSFEKVSLGRIQYSTGIEYFINVAGIGFDAETLRFYDKIKAFKLIRGSIGFIFSLLVVLFRYQSRPVLLKCDERLIDVQLYTVLFGLGKFLGGGLYMCPNADPRQTYFSVTLIEHVSIGKILRNVAKLFNGKIAEVKEVEILACKNIQIISSELISQIDGEIKESILESLQVQSSNLYLPFKS